MKGSLKNISVANDKNLRISESKVRSISELANQSYPQQGNSSPKQAPKEQPKEKLIEQNRRLKKQALELAEQMDQILSQQKFKKKYGVGAGQQMDRETQLKRLEARRQQLRIQELRGEIQAVKKENEYVYDDKTVVQKQNAIRALENELRLLQAERTSFLNVRKEQAKALTAMRNDDKYNQKIEKSRAQLAKLREQCKTLSAKTAENEKLLLRSHQKAVTKGKRLKQIEEKIKQNKEKMKKGNSNVVTLEMIAEIQAEILKLESEHRDSERAWTQKLGNLEAECANRRLQEEKKLIILRDKEKEAKLNQIRIKEFKKLIVQSRSERKDGQDNPKEYRSKRNIKYFERENS